jgi:hypothetical protein
LFECAVIILVHPINALTEREVGFCKIWLKPQSSFGLGAGFRLPGVSGLVIMENLCANRRQSSVSERKIRVQRNCLHVKLLGGLVILQERVGISRDLICAQIEHVCIRVLRRLRFHPRFLFPTKSDTKSIGNFGSQLSLQPKRINECTVVTVCPHMSIVQRID